MDRDPKDPNHLSTKLHRNEDSDFDSDDSDVSGVLAGFGVEERVPLIRHKLASGSFFCFQCSSQWKCFVKSFVFKMRNVPIGE